MGKILGSQNNYMGRHSGSSEARFSLEFSGPLYTVFCIFLQHVRLDHAFSGLFSSCGSKMSKLFVP